MAVINSITSKIDDANAVKSEKAGPINPGNPLHGRITFAVLSLVMICVLSAMLATRLKVLHPRDYAHLTAIRILTLLAYITALLFVSAVQISLSSWGLPTARVCYIGIELCLAFYMVSKIIIYMFLLERAIMVRNRSRYTDVYYLGGVFVIFAGLGTIAIVAFLWPVAQLSNVDNICRIGLPNGPLITLLIYDICLNFALTVLYVWITNQVTRNLTWASVGKVLLACLPFGSYGPLPTQASLCEVMMAKSIIGAAATVIGSSVNVAVLIYMRGHEQGWICFTICSIDVVWSVIIIHWLTSNPLELGDRNQQLHARPAVPAPVPANVPLQPLRAPAPRRF